MKQVVFLSCLFLASLTKVYAQPAQTETYAVCIQTGDEEFNKGQYTNASEFYEKAKKLTKKVDPSLSARIARTHFMERNFVKAESTLSNVLKRDKANAYNEDRLLYALALRANEKHTEALQQLQTYLNNNPESPNRWVAENAMKGIEMGNSFKDEVAIVVKNAQGLNCPMTDGSPALDDAGNIYFTSFQQKEVIKLEDANVDYTAKIYTANVKDGKWSKPEALSEEINSQDYHTSSPRISNDGSIMYFTRIKSLGGLQEESKVYVSQKNASGFSAPMEVKGINGEFLAQHATPGELFGEQVLFFSANIPGGKGGMDLYYAKKIAEAEFSDPVNLGERINSQGDERTPYYRDGSLYFSSNGHPGLGGIDIFVSKWDGSAWSAPENMGKPYNSSVDDFDYWVDRSGEKGFVVSNRADAASKSLKSKTCCDDIYAFEKKKLVISLAALVKDEKGKRLNGATVQLIEIVNNKEGTTESKTNGEGNGFNFLLDPDKSYKVVASKPGYFPTDIQLNTVGIKEDYAYNKEFKLKMVPVESEVEIITINEAIRLNNIYYDFDDDKILKDAESDLKVLMDLMTKYPDMVIELSSHTDARGIDAYNEKLSQRRANSAKRWLVLKGIKDDRIVAKGYGEDNILNGCTNGVECTDDEHRQNRRTEFKIIAGPTSIEIKKQVLDKKPEKKK